MSLARPVLAYSSTWGTNEDDVEDLTWAVGIAIPQDQLLESGVVIAIAVEANLVVGPVWVVDLIAGGEDELLIDAGRVTSGKGENSRIRTRPLCLIAPVIETES